MRELERTETSCDLPQVLCRAYTDDPATDDRLQSLRPDEESEAIIPCRRVVFALFQESPGGAGENLELFVQARVRPLATPNPPALTTH